MPRSELVEGDFFESVPSADTYILKKVIHDWDDERAAIILKNCRTAMTANGKFSLPRPSFPLVTILIPSRCWM